MASTAPVGRSGGAVPARSINSLTLTTSQHKVKRDDELLHLSVLPNVHSIQHSALAVRLTLGLRKEGLVAEMGGLSPDSHRENDYTALCLRGPHYNSPQTHNIAFTLKLAAHFKLLPVIVRISGVFSSTLLEKKYLKIYKPLLIPSFFLSTNVRSSVSNVI